MTYKQMTNTYYGQIDTIEGLWSQASKEKDYSGGAATMMENLCKSNLTLYADIIKASASDPVEHYFWLEQVKSIPAQKRLCMLCEKRKDLTAAKEVCVYCLKLSRANTDAKKRLAKYIDKIGGTDAERLLMV